MRNRDGRSVALSALLLAWVLLSLVPVTVSAGGYRAAFQDFTLDYDSRMSGSEYRKVYTRTLAGCARLCLPLALCRAFSYHRFSGSCALISRLSRTRSRGLYVTGVKIAPNASESERARAPSVVSGAAGAVSQQASDRLIAGMQLEYGVERLGDGYRRMPQQHAEDCARACGELESCLSFRYVPRDRQCVMFNALVDSRSRLGVVSGFRASGGLGGPAGRQWEQGGFALHQDVGLAGQDYRHQTTQDLQQCIEACEVDSPCQAFTFDAANRYCALKRMVPLKRYRKGVISGFRQRQQ